MTVEIFVFCGWRFSNQLDIVSETHFSCDSVDRELWLAILSSLLYPETDRNIRIGKQGYVFLLPILRSDVLMFHSSIGVSTVVLTLGKVEFFKSVSMRKPGRTRQEVIQLKSPIVLKLGINVGFGE